MKIKLVSTKGQFLLKFFTSRRNLNWFILFIILIWGGKAIPQMSFYVSPPLLEFDLIGGGVRNFTVEISNTGEEKIQVKTSFSDLLMSPEGRVELAPVGSTTYSISSWISKKDAELSFLEPGEIKKIPFELRVPRGEKGGRYGVAVFEALPFNIPQGKVALGIRSGTLIFLTIPRTGEMKGKIEDILSENGETFKVIFQNTGNIHIQTEGNLIVKSEQGRVLHRIRFPKEKSSMILPQGKREFIIEWDKKNPLPMGNYLLEVQMFTRIGNQLLNLDRQEIQFEVITRLISPTPT